jgi:hypothetical protein
LGTFEFAPVLLWQRLPLKENRLPTLVRYVWVLPSNPMRALHGPITAIKSDWATLPLVGRGRRNEVDLRGKHLV